MTSDPGRRDGAGDDVAAVRVDPSTGQGAGAPAGTTAPGEPAQKAQAAGGALGEDAGAAAAARDAEGEAATAELHDRTAKADARRAQESAEKAQDQAAKALDAAEAAEQAKRDAQEREERARREAAEARRRAEEAARDAGTAPSTVSAAALTSPGVGIETDPEAAAAAARGAATPRALPWQAEQGQPIVFGPFTADKPELLVAAAFAGAFVVAQILKRLTR